jgi:hypothetical protein
MTFCEGQYRGESIDDAIMEITEEDIEQGLSARS